jgi:hypothetical protein
MWLVIVDMTDPSAWPAGADRNLQPAFRVRIDEAGATPGLLREGSADERRPIRVRARRSDRAPDAHQPIGHRRLTTSLKGPWFFLTLIALLLFAVIEHGPILKQWTAMYPSDRDQRSAFSLCFGENHQFNRASAEARAACYDKWLQILSYVALYGPPVNR